MHGAVTTGDLESVSKEFAISLKPDDDCDSPCLDCLVFPKLAQSTLRPCIGLSTAQIQIRSSRSKNFFRACIFLWYVQSQASQKFLQKIPSDFILLKSYFVSG